MDVSVSDKMYRNYTELAKVLYCLLSRLRGNIWLVMASKVVSRSLSGSSAKLTCSDMKKSVAWSGYWSLKLLGGLITVSNRC